VYIDVFGVEPELHGAPGERCEVGSGATDTTREAHLLLTDVLARSRHRHAQAGDSHLGGSLREEDRDLHLDPATRIAVLGDKPIALTAVEFDLLLSLARAPGRVKTREQLLEEVRAWVEEHKRIKTKLAHVSQLAVARIRAHAGARKRRAGRS
jgi:DNA-binding response OmpR family regulator